MSSGFTVDGKPVASFHHGYSSDEFDVNDDPDLDPAYAYARAAQGASGYPAFGDAAHPHFAYPDGTQDNDYYGSGNIWDGDDDDENDEGSGAAAAAAAAAIEKMPEDYYHSLDHFLSKGAPTLRTGPNDGAKGKKKGSSNNVAAHADSGKKPKKAAVSAAASSGTASAVATNPYCAVKSSGYGAAPGPGQGQGSGAGKHKGAGAASASKAGGLDEALLQGGTPSLVLVAPLLYLANHCPPPRST